MKTKDKDKANQLEGKLRILRRVRVKRDIIDESTRLCWTLFINNTKLNSTQLNRID